MLFKHYNHSTVGAWLVRKKVARTVRSANDYIVIFCICILLLSLYIAFLPTKRKAEASLVERYGTIAKYELKR